MLIKVLRLLGITLVITAVSPTFGSGKNQTQMGPNSSSKDTSYSVQLTDKRNKETQNLNVTVPTTSNDRLQAYSPKNIPDFLQGQSAGASEMLAHFERSATLKQTAYDFPKESAVFFAGVGGVLLLEMMTHYENNPMAFAQQVESLTNPVGHFSFFMFMYANRISMTMWPKIIRSPALWPYLGMTVGMMASDLSSQVLEPLRSCAKDLLKNHREKNRAVPQSCTNAYQHLVLKNSILEMAPSLTSMLMSSWIAGTVQKALMEGFRSKAFAQVAKSPLVWRSVNVLSYFLPGKVPAKVGATALNFFQISLFVGVDHQLSPLVRKGWADMTQGYSLAKLTDSLTDEFLQLKGNQWVSPVANSGAKKCIEQDEGKTCYDGFNAQILEFQEKMAHWRQANLEPISIAHGSWSQKLSHLSASLDGSFSVYNHILNSIIESKQGKESPIDRNDSLNGIKPLLPQADQEFPKSGYLDGYWQLQNFRKARLKLGAKKLREMLAEASGAGQLPPTLQALEKVATLWEAREEGQMLNLLRAFRNGDVEVVSATESQLRRALEPLKGDGVEALLIADASDRSDLQDKQILFSAQVWFDRETEKMSEGVAILANAVKPTLGFAKTFQAPVKKIYDAILEEVGRPEPTSEKGKPYIQGFALHPNFGQFFELMEYPNSPGRFYLRNAAEYMVYQMLCGPEAEAKQSVIKTKWADYDEFFPPMIRQKEAAPVNFCNKDWFGPKHSMYSETISVLKEDGSYQSFDGVFGYLKANVRPSVVDAASSKNNLKTWWDNHVGIQVDGALASYSKDYDKIIKQFRQLTTNRNLSTTNMGPIFNSPLWALQQEMRFYELVLVEMIRDLGDQRVLGATDLTTSPLKISRDEVLKEGLQMPLFTLLRDNAPTDFGVFSKSFFNKNNQVKFAKPSGDFEVIKRVDVEVNNLIHFITQIQNSKEVTRQANDAYRDASLSLEQAMNELDTLVNSEGMSALTAEQRATIEICQDGIKKNIKELNNFRLIITLLSRDGESKRDDNNCRPNQNRVGKISVDCME